MVFLILLSMNVSAFAITSYYWDEKPLYLEPGQTVEVQAFGLQNMIGGEDITVKVTPGAGQEIAEITDGSLIYKVPFGRKDIYVNMRVSIPEDTKTGTEYDIGASFSKLTENEGRMIQLTTRIDNSIKIIVGKPPEEIKKGVGEKEVLGEGMLITMLVLIIVIVAVLIYYFGIVKGKKIFLKRR